jgi:hypothetical protein
MTPFTGLWIAVYHLWENYLTGLDSKAKSAVGFNTINPPRLSVEVNSTFSDLIRYRRRDTVDIC